MKRPILLALTLTITIILFVGVALVFNVKLPTSLSAIIHPPFSAEFEQDSAKDDPITRTWLLPRNTELPADFVLVLSKHATGGPALIITDARALQAAQNVAYIEHKTMSTGQSVFVSLISFGTALTNLNTLAYMGWSGELHHSFSCWWCAAGSKEAHARNFAGLLEAGLPVENITLEFDDKTTFLTAQTDAYSAADTWVVKSTTFWVSGAENNNPHGRLTIWRLPQS